MLKTLAKYHQLFVNGFDCGISLILVIVMVADVESLALMKQAGAAAFYGASSLLIIMVNKAVLTSYGSVSCKDY